MTDEEFSSKELTLAGDQMPAPRKVVTVLRERLNKLVGGARAARGEVRMPEDTYELVRSLMSVRDGAQDYAFAFTTIRAEIDAFIQDDLELAVGEQDGVPNSGMKVPDVDGTDIAVTLDTRNEYGFDVNALAAAVTFEVLTEHDVALTGGEEATAEMVMAALERLVSLGRFQPQVTKVRVFADDIARMPDGAAIAATVRAAGSRTTQFRGIKVERKQPK